MVNLRPGHTALVRFETCFDITFVNGCAAWQEGKGEGRAAVIAQGGKEGIAGCSGTTLVGFGPAQITSHIGQGSTINAALIGLIVCNNAVLENKYPIIAYDAFARSGSIARNRCVFHRHYRFLIVSRIAVGNGLTSGNTAVSREGAIRDGDIAAIVAIDGPSTVYAPPSIVSGIAGKSGIGYFCHGSDDIDSPAGATGHDPVGGMIDIERAVVDVECSFDGYGPTFPPRVVREPAVVDNGGPAVGKDGPAASVVGDVADKGGMGDFQVVVVIYSPAAAGKILVNSAIGYQQVAAAEDGSPLFIFMGHIVMTIAQG